MGSGGDPTPPVPAAHFQYRRTPRDRLWALLFALAWVAAVVGGIYAIQHRNPAFIHLDYTDPASCPAHPEARRALLEALHEKHRGDWSPSQFVQFTGTCNEDSWRCCCTGGRRRLRWSTPARLQQLELFVDSSARNCASRLAYFPFASRLPGRWLVLSAGLALLLGVAFVKLFQHHAAVMTKATVASQVAVSCGGWAGWPAPAGTLGEQLVVDASSPAALIYWPPLLSLRSPCPNPLAFHPPPQIPAAAAVVFLLNGQGTTALVFGGLALLAAWVFSLWRHQIALATRLLGVSAHGLAANSGIITSTVLLNLAALLAVLPLGAFLGVCANCACAPA